MDLTTLKSEIVTNASDHHSVAFFPGSTIGNFTKEEALVFLQNIARFVEPGGKLLIGVDGIKDVRVLESAYNDARGVTKAFNENLLHRLNRELEADFDVNLFEHRAHFNPEHGRIEMHLICLNDCVVTIDDNKISFLKGESIHTENSFKYRPEEFIALAHDAGFHLVKKWTDQNNYFNVFLFEV